MIPLDTLALHRFWKFDVFDFFRVNTNFFKEVDAFVVYWLGRATSDTKCPGSNSIQEPLLVAKAVHLQPVQWSFERTSRLVPCVNGIKL